MNPIDRRSFLALAATAATPLYAAKIEEWVDLFDGKSLKGWRPSENKGSWSVVEGSLTANGPRSHLFYTGPVRTSDFKNFELEVDLVTQPECNSGIYFHTQYQESGFPEKGFEIQINNSALGDGGYLERKKTASLYGIRNIYKQLVPDQKPFTVHVTVRGKTVHIRLNNQLLVDYTEPTPPVIPEGGEKSRFLDHGTFALQCHNDGSKVAYRRVRVRPLPDDLPAYTSSAPVLDETYRDIINIGRHNVPMVDFDIRLCAGMTLDQLLAKSRADGIFCGVVAPSTQFANSRSAQQWLSSFAGRPVFTGLYATDSASTRMLSKDIAQRFDYIVADSRTWMKDGGAVPLWTPGAASKLPDHQAFMDSLIDQAVARMESEPIDIYAFPTYLPPELTGESDKLWTDPRRTKLINALLKNKVAVELNSRDKLPDQSFVEQARDAGVKFAFGTGNQTAAELKRCEYGLEIVKACKLDWKNFYAPGSWWPKAADRHQSA